MGLKQGLTFLSSDAASEAVAVAVAAIYLLFMAEAIHE